MIEKLVTPFKTQYDKPIEPPSENWYARDLFLCILLMGIITSILMLLWRWQPLTDNEIVYLCTAIFVYIQIRSRTTALNISFAFLSILRFLYYLFIKKGWDVYKQRTERNKIIRDILHKYYQNLLADVNDPMVNAIETTKRKLTLTEFKKEIHEDQWERICLKVKDLVKKEKDKYFESEYSYYVRIKNIEDLARIATTTPLERLLAKFVKKYNKFLYCYTPKP